MEHSNRTYEKVRDVRERLAQCGVVATPEEVRLLSDVREASVVRKALAVADTNPEALNYLKAAIEEVRLPPMVNGAGQGTQAAAPSAAPPESRTQQVPAARDLPARPPLPNSRLSMVHHRDPIKSMPPTVASDNGQPVAAPPPVTSNGSENAQRDAGGESPHRDDFHIYGGKAALTVSPGENRKRNAVVFIDAAPATAPLTYAWSDKITLMLTPDEILITLAVVMGQVGYAKFNNHGEAKDKWFEIEHQNKSIFIKIGQAQKMRAIPVSPPDAYKLAAVLTAQVRRNTPQGARADVANLVRTVVGPMLRSAGQAPAPRAAAGGSRT